mmetsp:Transcript_6484/g.7883  ORF Transcript_6484/g.7883 Transcript_6484/m.7883 type:complete len:329 (+) Transcript_6484:127-1113(+)
MSWNNSVVVSKSDSAESPELQSLGIAVGIGAVTVLVAGAGLLFNSKSKSKLKSILQSVDGSKKEHLKLKSSKPIDGFNINEANENESVSYDSTSDGEPEMEMSPVKLKPKLSNSSQSLSQSNLESRYRETLDIVAGLRGKLAREMAKHRKLEEEVRRITQDNKIKIREQEIGLTKAFEKRFADLRRSYEGKLHPSSNQKGAINGKGTLQEIEILRKSLKEKKEKFERQRFELQQNQIQLNGAMAKLDSQAQELEFERNKLHREASLKKNSITKHQNQNQKGSKQNTTKAPIEDQHSNRNTETLLRIERETRQIESAAILGLVAFIFAW